MSYNSAPSAEHIQEFAKRMEELWKGQDALDQRMLEHLTMQNPIDVAQAGNGKGPPKPVKAFRSGIGGILWREDSALLTVTPAIHVNPPTDKEEDRAHASEVLEPFFAGAWKRSQQNGLVWDRLPGDLRGVGRFWFHVYPHPAMWADDEYRDLVTALVASDDAEERRNLNREIQAFKRDRWPIRWTYVSPIGTWTTFGGQHWLPEVVEVRKMSQLAIVDEYGEDALPLDSPKKGTKLSGLPNINVYTWANHYYCATVIGSKAEPKLVHEYEHRMGCNPYVLGEAELLPENEANIRWAGALFYAEDTIDTFDEVLSDWRHSVRLNTRTPIVQYLDQESYSDDALTGGRPSPIPYGPDSVIPLWKGKEEIVLGPVPLLNPQSPALYDRTYQLLQQNMIRPVERGQALSGASNNLFTTQVQIAEREFDPSMRALKHAAEEWARRVCRSIIALNRDYPDAPDEVYVYDEMGERGVIGVGPKDIKGWENAIQARASRAIPIDRMVQIQTVRAGLDAGISRETMYEQEAGFENPRAEIRKRDLEDLRAAVMEQARQQVQLRAGQMLSKASPDQLNRITELMAGASPALQGVLSGQVGPQGQLGPQSMPGPQGPEQGLGGLGQALGNLGRTGSPQMPQMPQQGVLSGGPMG